MFRPNHPRTARHSPTMPTTPIRLPVVATVLLATALAAQTPDQAALQVTTTAQTSPPALMFQWPFDATATAYRYVRRTPGAIAWGAFTLIPGGGAITSWTDTAVVPGQRYEYLFQKNGGTLARSLLVAGIEADPIESRGAIVLLVDASMVAPLGSRLDRLEQDLAGDGWLVLRHDVPRTDPVQSVKAQIIAEVAARPGQVQAVFLLGHVPVPYSGAIAPDGHPDHNGAWAADVYYGEIDGVWTDTSINVVTASRLENRNAPGDGKFDQSSLPSNVDLAVGRVDLANMPAFGVSEAALLQQYLDKDHDYRHQVFAVDQRALIDDNFGWFGGEAFAASGWRNANSLVGPAATFAGDYLGTLTAPGNGYAWSYGCGGGSYNSAGGIGTTTDFAANQCRTVFTMLFGSYFGDWDSTDNFLRAPLCSGWTLTNAWAGRPHWSFHPMGLGDTVGACARYSQNDTMVGGFGTRSVHLALMGDPTLRQHVVAPPANVAVADAWPQAQVSWTPSADAVAGYHVYRAAQPGGPFARISAAPVAGTSFADPQALAGASTYMVRALRLETVPSGSYWNLSQGAFADTQLPQQGASHQSYGIGCYTISDSFWQYHANAAAAAAALDGQSITLTPSGTGYAVTAGGGAFVPPGGGAQALALGDDTAVAVALAQPFPFPGGSTTTLFVHSNGIVAAAPLLMSAATAAAPSPAAMLGEGAPAWYCWHDFDPTEPGSGAITVATVGGIVLVTWDGVESHPAPLANPSTLQFQFDPATGVVRYVWGALAATGTGQATAPSEQFLIGWSPGGASVDAGPIDLAADLPVTVGAVNMLPLSITASPPPVSTPNSGTLITYTVHDIPAASPGNHLGYTVLGLQPDFAGTDLSALGLPGCINRLASVDLTMLFVSPTSTATTTLALPAGMPKGLTYHAMAIAFVYPYSLPNGQNGFGGVVSNGLSGLINDH